MSLTRVWAVFMQELYHSRKSFEVWFDLVFFSFMNVVLFGFIARLFGNSSTKGASYVLLGVLCWEVIRINQYSVSVGTLWNVWSRNLSNIFITPISVTEYMFAHMLSAAFKAAILFVGLSAMAKVAFNFNILALGWPTLIAYFLNLTLFAWWLGLLMLGLIFRFGVRIQALAWGIIFIFEPLTAAFFPVKVLPDFLQKIAWGLPPTYLFEAGRTILQGGAANWNAVLIATVLNIFYFITASLVFAYLFKMSKQSGQFARNES